MNGLQSAAVIAVLLLKAHALAAKPTATPTVSPSPTEEGSRAELIVWPTFTPPPGNLLSISPALYDIEGKEGTPTLGSPNLDGKYFEYQFKGEPPVRIPGQTGSFEYIEKPSGTPFLYRVHADQFGTVVGFGRLSGHAYVVIPVKGSEVGIHMEKRNWDPFNTGGMVISFEAFVADSIKQPSVLMDYIPNSASRLYDIRIDYLPGNVLSDVGTQAHTFPAGTFGPDTYPDAYWGETSISHPQVRQFSNLVPYGSLKASLSVQGFAEDSVTVASQDKIAFHFQPLLVPVSPPTIAERVGLAELSAEEGDFIREVGMREDLLGESRCFTNLLGASDVNGDGCIDAADYQAVVSRMAVEAR